MSNISTTSTTKSATNFFACDHVGKRIYGSEANFKKAEILDTPQYKALMVLMERHSNYRLDPVAPEFAKQSYKGMNFDFMMEYVYTKGTEIQKAEFEEIVNGNAKFPAIKSWFVENFKAGFTVEKAKREIEIAKRNAKAQAAQAALKEQKATVRKVVKARMAKADEAQAPAPLALASNY